MRLSRKLAFLSLLLVAGCRSRTYVAPESPLPPNTILLSQVMREQPSFVDKLLANVNQGGKPGAALLTPALVDELRKRILGSDWSGLDRFPGWTMRQINPAITVAGKVEGAPLANRAWIDTGPYTFDKAEIISLDQPSTLPGFSADTKDLGNGITRGDGANALASEHAESLRLADALNRLAVNKLDGAKLFQVKLHEEVDGDLGLAHKQTVTVQTPEQLIEALEKDGYQITVTDSRYFANFAHMHYSAHGPSQLPMDVMAPFWIDTRHAVPNTNGRHLLIPVSHAELEWHIRPPAGAEGITADISYYFGIDGKSEWRTMDTQDQPWVSRRDAHTYTAADAVEATRLAGALTVAYMHLHAAHSDLPFGGYYALGVCQDGISAIELKLTNAVTLFPNTADAHYFTDARDPEINKLFSATPKDRDDVPPSPARVFGSLPADPGPNGDFSAITIPGLAQDLAAAHFAWQNGTLDRSHHRNHTIAFLIVLAVIGIVFIGSIRRRNIAEADFG